MDRPLTSKETIFALSSAPGRAGVAVIRVSGPAVSDVGRLMAPPDLVPRRAALRKIVDPLRGDVLDRGLVLLFQGPDSFTGEDVLEFHLHGGRAVVQAIMKAIGVVSGCRIAEPGEFTLRAFEAGRIDLAEAEGLADLIDAETEAQRVQAQAQADGVFSSLCQDWRAKLIAAMGLVEATIDFSDEADVSDKAWGQAADIVGGLIEDLKGHLDDGNRGEILREGFHVALLGPPNAGKSSLLNALARRDVAIVSSEPGTTRDVIEVRLDLKGLPVVVIDTAGIRAATGGVEREGIRRSLKSAWEADLVVWLHDVTAQTEPLPDEVANRGSDILFVGTKCDLLEKPLGSDVIVTSAKTGAGIDEFTDRLAQLAGERLGHGEAAIVTQARHRQHLEYCRQQLICFREGEKFEPELRAEDLRLAAQALGRITGHVDPEDVLDQIFGRFCIGK